MSDMTGPPLPRERMRLEARTLLASEVSSPITLAISSTAFLLCGQHFWRLADDLIVALRWSWLRPKQRRNERPT